jgi:predicted Zn-dependent protease
MGLNDVTFIKGQGGLGRPLPGEDFISGLLFYINTLPSGFSTSNRVQQIFSLADAVALGINLSYSDETQATATYLVTTAGATGDVANITVTEVNGIVNLGTYIKASTDTSPKNVILLVGNPLMSVELEFNTYRSQT